MEDKIISFYLEESYVYHSQPNVSLHSWTQSDFSMSSTVPRELPTQSPELRREKRIVSFQKWQEGHLLLTV